MLRKPDIFSEEYEVILKAGGSGVFCRVKFSAIFNNDRHALKIVFKSVLFCAVKIA